MRMKAAVGIILVSLGCLGLARCSFPSSKKISPSSVFQFPLTEEARIAYDGDPGPTGLPSSSAAARGLSAAGGKVFFSTSRGTVYAVDVAARKTAWEFAAKDSLPASLSVSPDQIIFTGRENSVTCLTPDGKLRWQKKMEAPVSAAAVQNEGVAFLIAGETELVALDTATGKEAWRFKAPSAIRALPVFWNRQIIIGTAGKTLHFLRATGQQARVTALDAGLAGPLLVRRDRVFFGLEDGTFQCLALGSKRRVWKIKTGGTPTAAPVADGDLVFVPASNNALFCIERGGDLLWWHLLPSRAPFEPTVCDNCVLASSLSTRLLAYLKTTGEAVGSFDAGEDLRSGPVRVGGNLLVTTYNPDTDKGSLLFLKGTAPAIPAKK